MKEVEKSLRGGCGNEKQVTGLRENTTAVEALNISDDLVDLSDVTRRRDGMHLFSNVVKNISRAKNEKIESGCCLQKRQDANFRVLKMTWISFILMYFLFGVPYNRTNSFNQKAALMVLLNYYIFYYTVRTFALRGIM